MQVSHVSGTRQMREPAEFRAPLVPAVGLAADQISTLLAADTERKNSGDVGCYNESHSGHLYDTGDCLILKSRSHPIPKGINVGTLGD